MLDAIAKRLEAELADIRDKDALSQLKHKIVRELQLDSMPGDADLLPFLSPAARESHGHLFRKKPMRSESGVAIIAVMSSPAACPHGKCIYCPGGPEVDAPQSYTGFEPSTMRAKRHDYDSYRIVRGRLQQLARNGHAVDKLEVIVQGGTFPARDGAYQDWFIHGIFQACNDGPSDADEPADTEEGWAAMRPDQRLHQLAEAQKANEAAACRVIGLTIETKPDWCLEPHVDGMISRGATRVELGIQTLDEEVTRLTNRGHTVQDARDAMRIIRDAGLKMCVHMMPGLPRPQAAQAAGRPDGVAVQRGRSLLGGVEDAQAAGRPDAPVYAVDPDADVEDMRQLFADPDFRPDMLKIYPTLVVKDGETTIKKWYQNGTFEPLDTAKATDIVARSKPFVEEYCRIQRIDRDIPTTHVLAGVMNSNLRQLAQQEMARRGTHCRCIRCREVSIRLRDGATVSPARLELVRRDYEASGGLEVFLSFEDPETDSLVAFLRLRRLGAPYRAELAAGQGFIRELKVYGVAQALGVHDDPETGAWQHQGFGARLLAEAERIAADWHPTIGVVAGAGVKQYYRNHGYVDAGPYLQKVLQA